MLIKVDPETEGHLRAVFTLTGPRQTRIELVIKPSGDEEHGDRALSELWRLIENTRFAVNPHS